MKSFYGMQIFSVCNGSESNVISQESHLRQEDYTNEKCHVKKQQECKLGKNPKEGVEKRTCLLHLH